MRLVIRDDPESVGKYVAQLVVDRINKFKPNANKYFVLGLPTGSSPIPTYKALIEKHRRGEVINFFFFFAMYSRW